MILQCGGVTSFRGAKVEVVKDETGGAVENGASILDDALAVFCLTQ
jgi:hypothetical protein